MGGVVRSVFGKPKAAPAPVAPPPQPLPQESAEVKKRKEEEASEAARRRRTGSGFLAGASTTPRRVATGTKSTLLGG